MSEIEIDAEIAKQDCPLLEKIVGKIAKAAADKADQVRMEFFLNRLIGKVQDRIEVTSPTPFIIHKSDGSQIVCGSEVKKEEK